MRRAPLLPLYVVLLHLAVAPGMGQLNISLLFAVFMTSAVLGDAVNYAIGNKLGELFDGPHIHTCMNG